MQVGGPVRSGRDVVRGGGVGIEMKRHVNWRRDWHSPGGGAWGGLTTSVLAFEILLHPGQRSSWPSSISWWSWFQGSKYARKTGASTAMSSSVAGARRHANRQTKFCGTERVGLGESGLCISSLSEGPDSPSSHEMLPEPRHDARSGVGCAIANTVIFQSGRVERRRTEASHTAAYGI
jgi:hypothetical protein